MKKKEEGKLIIIASHLLDNLEKYAARIFLFKEGKLIDVNAIVDGFSESTLTTVRVKNMPEPVQSAFQSRYPAIQVQTLVNGMTLLTLEQKDTATLSELTTYLADCQLHEFSFGKVTLNDLYAMYYHEVV
ncbi:hypothetical protein [Lysinibacillus piscis]|uniref:ABC transporter ATP-binding protein n=1 Tax=Lysinibacillus piscis TaxID=2518931 RepID=A0ABQ5NJB6_9BACI|nr:hypothetical protein [Lysinibacillus sp. KH24]GLC88467.1 hypothetical protein LYSBPC_15940 [Lysinibacillus sp. KH24]